jgi:CheY-like chemotaxis protein
MQSALERAAPSIAPAASPRHILVADDNVDAADSLAMLLRAEGHQVSIAYDAATALEIARRTLPGFLLLDIGLPGTDGYALAGSLRELTELRNATLIAVTGYGQAEDRERSQAAGFDHHLVKPIWRCCAPCLQKSGGDQRIRSRAYGRGTGGSTSTALLLSLVIERSMHCPIDSRNSLQAPDQVTPSPASTDRTI